MSEREPRFKYRLDPLARLRAAQRDAARAEAARATRELELHMQEGDAIAQRMQAAQDAVRESSRRGAAIRPDEQLRMREYLHRQRDQQAAKAHEVEHARLEQARALAALQGAHQTSKALNLHRERMRGQFEQHRKRAAANAADDRWLARRAKRPG